MLLPMPCCYQLCVSSSQLGTVQTNSKQPVFMKSYMAINWLSRFDHIRPETEPIQAHSFLSDPLISVYG